MTIQIPVAKPLTIGSKTETPLSAILMKPRDARGCFVFAHGAGAGMSHPFMEQIAAGLYGRGIATLRYQFPFMEKRQQAPSHQRLLTQPSALQRPRPGGDAEGFRFSRVASRSAAS
jgi:hypothetical protein